MYELFSKFHFRFLTVATAVLLALPLSGDAAGLGAREGVANETPKELLGIGIDEHLGASIDLNLRFKDENGLSVKLGDYFKGEPVILSLAYYSCPNLCNMHLNGMKDVFKKMDWVLGEKFKHIIVSIDPKETPELALAKKKNYLESYGRADGSRGWVFLTGDEAQIQALAKQVGFGYRWDEAEKQYAHAAAAYVLTPAGKISRYLYGIDFQPQTVKLALLEASNGKIGNIIDKFTLFCFHYDPKANKYTLAAVNIMKAGGALAVLVMAGFMAPFWMRQRRDKKV